MRAKQASCMSVWIHSQGIGAIDEAGLEFSQAELEELQQQLHKDNQVDDIKHVVRNRLLCMLYYDVWNAVCPVDSDLLDVCAGLRLLEISRCFAACSEYPGNALQDQCSRSVTVSAVVAIALCFCVVFVVVEGVLRPVSLRSRALV